MLDTPIGYTVHLFEGVRLLGSIRTDEPSPREYYRLGSTTYQVLGRLGPVLDVSGRIAWDLEVKPHVGEVTGQERVQQDSHANLAAGSRRPSSAP